MDSIGAFFAMSGYAAYIWPAFAVTLGLMAGLAFWTRRRLKASERLLAALEAEAAAAEGGADRTDGSEAQA